jgi:hypothetical protein
MKFKMLGALLLLAASVTMAQTPAQGDHRVRGYEKKNGTVVEPHYQTNPNRTQKDNYGSKGITNPHTSREGTKTPKH